MRKDYLKNRSEGNSAPLTSDDSDAEANGTNNDPSSAEGDLFDSLLSSKASESGSSKKTNGVSKRVPSPLPDDSDTEKDESQEEDEPSKIDDSTASESNEATKNDVEEKEKEKENNEENEEDGYEVESIVEHKYKGKKKYYRIRWKGWSEDDDTWELEANLSCPELIESYLEKNPDTRPEPKSKKAKKVRISLPPRETPKRSAQDNKSLVESDQDSGSDSSEENKSKKKKAGRSSKRNEKKDGRGRGQTLKLNEKKDGRGRPPKNLQISKDSKKGKAQEEYEVARIIDDENRQGKIYYRIRWKGWGAKDDTWEPKNSLNCPDKIKEYEASKDVDYEVEKIVGEKIEYGCRYFLVKWKNWSEGDNSWENAADVECDDLIEKFRESCRSGSGKSTKATKRSASSKKPKNAKKSKNNDVESETDPLANGDDDDDNDGGDEEQEWEVEKILDQRKKGNKKQYLIRWKNCDESQDTWEPEDGINCPALVAAFEKNAAKKKKK